MSWENKPAVSDTSHRLGTVEQVEEVVGRAPALIALKEVRVLDEGSVTVLRHSPIAGFGHRDADGTSRTTFVGGRAGFARVLSPTRISFALGEPGAVTGPASLVFLLPGVGETLRVNGSASGSGEVVFDVEQVYVHCAQAVLRSGLWQPPKPAGPAAELAPGPLAAPGVADFLAAAPFLALSTWDSAGGSDTSPRGESRTVARALDGHTLVIADRRGNKRADSLHNLLQDDRLSFAALVPGRTGVLHVRGRGAITVDPAVLEPLSLRGIPPHAALLVDVESAELTASDAVARARLWTAPAPAGGPDLLAVASGHLALNSRQKPGFLLKLMALVPAGWLRAVSNVAYRSGLRKEGYEVAPTARPSAAAPEDPLREVRVVDVRRETPTAVTLVLEDVNGTAFSFQPGQFFTLLADIDGRRVRRPYSASSAPGSPRLELTVKHIADGRFSTHVHRGLAAGDHLLVRGPSGAFRLVPGHDVVLVAAGSGVTPMMSMIRTLLAEPAGPRIALLYSNRSREDTIFAAELADLARGHDRFSVTHVVTSRDGRLDRPGVRRWLADLDLSPAPRFYLCGPERFMDTARQAIDAPAEHVHLERYTGGPAEAVASATPQRMVVEGAGTAVVEPGQTLLDAGLAAGLPMPYSCTVGSCGECVVTLLGGQVSQQEPNCLTARQQAEGRILTCTSAPLTDVTLDLR
ncbi:2Fe-2S iron-sulfur cluster-binding protein [Nocardia sp. NRRL S-836]|uniref:2Fe-2S iron-sulfur cluster-binding protein n=1 Tax=Nocardia sp. NRRL S-836 TaxID=1519492 RepID=UPI0006AF56F3|nr:2Fe-2S iron-sulfur cluster-binding protein [Nocardia sp. NRRL S-836]KOV83246.1 phenylacetate-CoA oxygenase [Nocardia sp. NRRL S-836]